MKLENFKYNNDTKKGDCCPECKGDWDGGDIYEYFLEAKFNPNHKQHYYYKDKSIKEINKTAGSYGWSAKALKRFGNVIGIDCSMDPDADGVDQYDGISYWQCPNCEIAWNRFSGERTGKFVKSASACVIKMLNELKEEVDKQIIYNAIRTPDGTVISSDHRHDYVTHLDKNGKTYGVDGGTEYLRRIGDTSDCEDLSMYLEKWSPEFHEKARKVVKRGGRGKDGRQPLTWVPICEMNDNWVMATIEYNDKLGIGIDKSWFTYLLQEEIHYRNTNSITIKD